MYWPPTQTKSNKPSWMSDIDWRKSQQGGIEYRPMTEGWTAEDYLRPKEWSYYSKATGKPAGAGYSKDLYRTYQPAISRAEFSQSLQDAWRGAPMTTATQDGQTIASRTFDPSGVRGYNKWAYDVLGSDRKQPITTSWILPEGALDFRFSQTNAPLSDVARSRSWDVGGAYTNAMIEPSSTRFTSGAFDLPQRQTQFGLAPVGGGLIDYTRGRMFTPPRGASSNSYARFGGYSPTLGAVQPQQVIPLALSNWRDEWAQKKQGFPNYQEYLHRDDKKKNIKTRV